MRIALAGFQGEIPQVEERALADQFSVNAINAIFENGAVAPIRQPTLVHQFLTEVASFYLFNGTWIGWASVVDVALAPIAANRIYFTGDGVPKVRDGATTYVLALPAPVSGPSVVNLTTPDPNFLETVFFCYTYVTSLGEESAPSPLSASLDTSAGVGIRVDGFSTAPAGRAITHLRIYRSQTSASGATGLYFVTEITTATTLFDHYSASLPLGELLPSADYDMPPDDLLGLTTMPNGMMAAFRGNEVYFCEPYRPHAWPEKYTMLVDYPIVGLAAFGSNLAVLTTGTPYVMQGTHPESMASEKMEAGMPCLSRRGIVDIGYAALYPSNDGLVMISSSEAKLITKGLFSREQWIGYSPTSIIADRFRGKYIFLRNVSTFTIYNGGGPDGYGVGVATDFVCSGPTLAGIPTDYIPVSGGTPDSSFGLQSLGMIDLESASPHFVKTDLLKPKAMYNDPATNNLYALASDSLSVYKWEDETAAPSVFTWRSKLFSSFIPQNFSAAFIRTQRPLITDDQFSVSLYGDGELVDTLITSNAIERVAPHDARSEWQIEISSSVPVVMMKVAGDVDELMVG